MTISIDCNGTACAIWHDDLAGTLRSLGKLNVCRASHVEPTEDGQWTADLSPLEGPTLGPFQLRQQALEAEYTWLEKHLFHDI